MGTAVATPVSTFLTKSFCGAHLGKAETGWRPLRTARLPGRGKDLALQLGPAVRLGQRPATVPCGGREDVHPWKCPATSSSRRLLPGPQWGRGCKKHRGSHGPGNPSDGLGSLLEAQTELPAPCTCSHAPIPKRLCAPHPPFPI